MKTEAIKTISLWIVIVCISLAGATFISCDGDTGSSKNPNTSPTSGIWKCQQGHYTYTVTFSSNGTGTFVSQYNNSNSGVETYSYTFTYVLSDDNRGTASMKVNDSYSGSYTETFYFEIEGNTMQVYRGSTDRTPDFVFTKDSSTPGNNSGAIGKLAGTWTKKLGNTGVAGIKFTSNGKFYFNEWGVKEQPNFDNVIVPADYKVSGSTITITHSMEPDYYVKSNDGNTLTITNISSEYHDLSGTWTRLN